MVVEVAPPQVLLTTTMLPGCEHASRFMTAKNIICLVALARLASSASVPASPAVVAVRTSALTEGPGAVHTAPPPA